MTYTERLVVTRNELQRALQDEQIPERVKAELRTGLRAVQEELGREYGAFEEQR